MATFFKNRLISNLGTAEELVISTNNNTRITVIGLSLTNLTDGITNASIRIENFWTAETVANLEGETTLTVSDVNADRILKGYVVTGTYVQPGTTILSIVNNGIDDNTVTLSKPSLGGPITSITVTGTAFFVKNTILPISQTLRVVNGGEKLVLGANMRMYVQSNTDNSIDFICSYVEIV